MPQIKFSYASQVTHPVSRWVVKLVERVASRAKLEILYLTNRHRPVHGETFWSAAVRLLKLDVRYDQGALARVSAKVPLVVVANHPYGALDGLTLSWLLEKVRGDVRIMMSAVLETVPELAPYIIPVDLSDRPEAMSRNLAARRSAFDHVQQGGALVVFPAGLISTSADRWGRGIAIDSEWKTFSAQLARRTGASVLPVFFRGQNSRLFQCASHIHRSLKLALIFREVVRRTNSTVDVVIGELIAPEEIGRMGDNGQITQALRRRTYALAASTHGDEDRML